MNQTFKQKAVVASLAAAFTFGAVGAQANTFADTTQVATITAGQNVPKAAVANLGNQNFVLRGNVGGAISAGTIVLALDNSAKFKAARVTSDAGISVTANDARTITVAAPAATGTSTITVGGVVFTGTYTNNTAASGLGDTMVWTSDATGSTVLNTTTAAAGANNAVEATVTELAAGLSAAINAVFGATASTAAVAVVTLDTQTAFPLNTGVASGAANATISATAGIFTNVDAAGGDTLFVTSAGKLSFTVATPVPAAADQLRLASIVLNTSASTADTPIAVSVDSSSTSTGVTTGTNTTIATPKTGGVTVANAATIAGAASTTPVTLVPGGSANIYDIRIAENVPGVLGAYTASGAAVGEVRVTLPAGWRFASNSNATVAGGTLALSNANESNGLTLSEDITGSTTITAGSVLLGGNTTALRVTAPADAAVGDYSATVRVYTANDTFTDTVVKIATVVANGTSASVVKSTATTVDIAEADLPTVYSGRVYDANQNVNIPTATTTTAYNLYQVKLQERGVATLASGATVTATLGNGKFDTLGGTYAFDPAASNTLDLGAAVLSNGNATATFTTSAVSVGTPGAPLIALFNDGVADGLDLRASSAGNLTVALAGTAGVTPQTLTVAKVADATSASISGTAPVVIAGQTAITLPSLVITEAAAGVLAQENGTRGGTIELDLSGTGYTFASNVATVATATAKDAAATVTVARASDTRVTITLPGTLATSAAQTITVSGLKVDAGSSAAGDLSLVVNGAYGDGTGAALVSTAQPTYKKLKVATTVGTDTPVYPTATVADQTKAVITGLPLVAAGKDQGKPGSVYVAVIFQGNVFFLGANGTWVQYTSSATVPAYATGTLGTTVLNVLPTAIDLTPIKGAQLVAGYGLGIAGLSNPFDDFIKNARYNVVYEVK